MEASLRNLIFRAGIYGHLWPLDGMPLGRLADHALLHIAASATARWFLRQVATALTAAGEH
jgi:hypothetical protein